MAMQIFWKQPSLEDVERLLRGCADEIDHLGPEAFANVRLLGQRETAEVPQITLQLLAGLTMADQKDFLQQEILLIMAYLRGNKDLLEEIRKMYLPKRRRGRPALTESELEGEPSSDDAPRAPGGME
jgi:hypothetical protein